jgi:serine phosphatase RsbU (regulator of sigma subunit)/CHASE2 domain-containing sensor protein
MTDSWSRSDALSELEGASGLRMALGGLLAALLAAVLVAAPVLIPPLLTPRDQPGRRSPDFGLPVTQPLFDFFQRTGARRIGPEVEVVEFDEKSQVLFGGWPWSRFDIAEVLRLIEAQAPAAVGFDLLFPEPDRLTPERFLKSYHELSPAAAAEIRGLRVTPDQGFGLMLGMNGAPTVLARVGVADPLPPPVFQPEPIIKGQPSDTSPLFPYAISNVDPLDGRALGIGLVNSYPDRDGVVRGVPLVGRAAGRVLPSLALELVRVASGEAPLGLVGDRHALRAVTIGGRAVPTAEDGGIRLRFRDVPESQKTSASKIALGLVAPDRFKGKIVLVGLTSAGNIDVVSTPRAAQTYGVYVQAQAIDAILHGRVIDRPPWGPWLEWITGLAVAAAACLFLPRRRLLTIVGVAAGLLAAAVGASWFAFERGLLLDPAPVVAPGFAAAITMIALMFVRVRASLRRERSEREAASLIQLGMLIPRDRLRQVTSAVEIDAVLLPAQAVGGDLYDAFMLDEGRLCVLVGDVTGKGLPASLFMALAKALSRSLLMRPDRDLAQAVDGVNAELSAENGQDMQVSLLVGVLTLADGRLDLCCAGHENPLILDARGQVRSLPLEGGPPLCAMENYPYPVETYALAPGEALIFFTDGVTEAQGPGHELFGARRTLAAVSAAAGASALGSLVDGLVGVVRDFEAGAEPSDDLTILAIRRPPAVAPA